MTAPNDSHSATPLTRQQRRCIELVGKGLTSKQIARELGISPRTVDQHVAAAIEALGVRNRSAAVARLTEIGRAAEPANAAAPFMLDDAAPVPEPFVTAPVPTAPEPERVPSPPPPAFPRLGGRPNRASQRVRGAWMVRIAFAATMLSCLAILFILGLSDMASGAAS